MIQVEDLLREATAYLNRIPTAGSEPHVHDAFVIVAEQVLVIPRLCRRFRRMSRAEMS